MSPASVVGPAGAGRGRTIPSPKPSDDLTGACTFPVEGRFRAGNHGKVRLTRNRRCRPSSAFQRRVHVTVKSPEPMDFTPSSSKGTDRMPSRSAVTKRLKDFERVRCWTCSGSGLVGYHIPDECPTCGGGGTVIRYVSGVYAKYQGGPLLGKDRS